VIRVYDDAGNMIGDARIRRRLRLKISREQRTLGSDATYGATALRRSLT